MKVETKLYFNIYIYIYIYVYIYLKSFKFIIFSFWYFRFDFFFFFNFYVWNRFQNSLFVKPHKFCSIKSFMWLRKFETDIIIKTFPLHWPTDFCLFIFSKKTKKQKTSTVNPTNMPQIVSQPPPNWE